MACDSVVFPFYFRGISVILPLNLPRSLTGHSVAVRRPRRVVEKHWVRAARAGFAGHSQRVCRKTSRCANSQRQSSHAGLHLPVDPYRAVW